MVTANYFCINDSLASNKTVYKCNSCKMFAYLLALLDLVLKRINFADK